MTASSIAQFLPYFVPGIIGIGGADYDLQILLRLSKVLYRFHTIPPRWHSGIHKGERIRVLFYKSLFRQYQPIPALKGSVNAVVIGRKNLKVRTLQHRIHCIHNLARALL